eukprot:s523_g25.t1
MTPRPNGSIANPTPPRSEASVSAKLQEMEMFGQLFSSFNNATANGQASTKRLRPARQDATMPQAVEETGPSMLQQKGKHQSKGKGKGKSKTATKPAGTQPVALTTTDDSCNFGPWTDPHAWGQHQWLGPSWHSVTNSSFTSYTGHSPVYVPQAQSGPLSPSSHASAGNRMEDHHGEDTRKADHVIARGDDSWPAQGVEDQTAGVPGQRGSPQHGPADAGQAGALESHALVPGKAGPCSHGEDRVTVHRGGDRQVKISELETLVTGDSIKNFKSIRQLRESYQKEWAQFLREIQIRGAGDRLWTIFTELIGSAALHLWPQGSGGIATHSRV